jgi:hypothetical protein
MSILSAPSPSFKIGENPNPNSNLINPNFPGQNGMVRVATRGHGFYCDALILVASKALISSFE